MQCILVSILHFYFWFFRTAYDEDTDDEDSTSKVEAEESITCPVKKRKVEAAASVGQWNNGKERWTQ